MDVSTEEDEGREALTASSTHVSEHMVDLEVTSRSMGSEWAGCPSDVFLSQGVVDSLENHVFHLATDSSEVATNHDGFGVCE